MAGPSFGLALGSNPGQLGRRDRHRLALRPWPHEAAALQALGQQAHPLSVMPEHLDQSARSHVILHTDRTSLSFTIAGTRCTANVCVFSNG